jgi:hypothetical protein
MINKAFFGGFLLLFIIISLWINPSFASNSLPPLPDETSNLKKDEERKDNNNKKDEEILKLPEDTGVNKIKDKNNEKEASKKDVNNEISDIKTEIKDEVINKPNIDNKDDKDEENTEDDFNKIDLKKIYLPSIEDNTKDKDKANDNVQGPDKKLEDTKQDNSNQSEVKQEIKIDLLSNEPVNIKNENNENNDKKEAEKQPKKEESSIESYVNVKSDTKKDDTNIKVKVDTKDNTKEDKDLEQFLKNEILILGVEDDEIILGSLTSVGFVNSLDYKEYIEYLNTNFNNSSLYKNPEQEKAVEEIIEISWQSRNNQKFETNFLKKIQYDSSALSLLVINYVKKNDVNNLASLFYRQPYLVGVKDCVGNNLLQIAVYSGAYDVSRYLISIGINLDNKSIYGIDPYGSATIMEDKKLQELIFRAKK